MAFEHDYEAYPELTNRQLEELQFTSPHVQITEDFYAEVVKVHDGDTVTLRASFRDFDFPLRFLGVDAPEMSEGGEVARDWLKTKVLGKEVKILIDLKNRVGKYGRLLGRLFYLGMDVGEEELYLGLAAPFGKIKEGGIEDASKVFSLKRWL